MVDHMKRYTRRPATTTVLSVVQAAADLGVHKVTVVNKWTDQMNASLAAFFARGGVSVIGGATKSLHPADFHRFDAADHMQLAHDLVGGVSLVHPVCAGVYTGGASGIAERVAARLEAKFDKPVLCNQSAVIRHTLKMLGAWTPIAGHSRVLATP